MSSILIAATKITMEICKYCGKEFEKKLSLAAHIGHCKSKPNFINREYQLSKKKAEKKRK